MQERKRTGTAFPLVLLDAEMPDMDGFSVAEVIGKDPGLAGATVLMLTSAGQRGDAARCRALGIAVYLVKPVNQAELLDAILAGLGRPSESPDRLHAVPRQSLRAVPQKLRILLAEDNRVNQLVAARLLGNRGHTIVIAGNGREALAALDDPRSDAFDLILMDVQMPDMDGLDATRIIRARETVVRDASTDHRHDRPRHERRRGTLPGGGDGRVRLETDSARTAPGDD